MGFRVNGELFTIATGPRQQDATNVSLEVEGQATAEVRLTELDQPGPENGAGYYRTRVEGDTLLFQRALKTAPGAEGWRDWVDPLTIMSLSKTGIGFHVPFDLSSLSGLVGSIIDTVAEDFPSVVWLGDGYGPTEKPAGYLAVAVDNDEGEGYIPFWRKSS